MVFAGAGCRLLQHEITAFVSSIRRCRAAVPDMLLMFVRSSERHIAQLHRDAVFFERTPFLPIVFIGVAARLFYG